jgi:glycosyltransferase involved in cell wall biosynthesis
MTLLAPHQFDEIMTGNQPKVSIILPIYNAGNELRKSIQSFVYQTYANFALVLASNNSILQNLIS